MYDKRKKLNCELLPKGLADKIPSIHDNVEILAAGEKWRNLKAELEKASENLLGFYGGDGGRSEHVPPASADRDAQCLLDGVPLDELPGNTKQSERANLIRRKQALEVAVTLQQGIISETEIRVCREMLAELEPIVVEFERDVIRKFEELLKSLQTIEQFYDLLSIRGYKEGLRLGHWALMPLEKSLLFGSPGRPSLRFFLDERRKYWGL